MSACILIYFREVSKGDEFKVESLTPEHDRFNDACDVICDTVRLLDTLKINSNAKSSFKERVGYVVNQATCNHKCGAHASGKIPGRAERIQSHGAGRDRCARSRKARGNKTGRRRRSDHGMRDSGGTRTESRAASGL